MKSVQIRTFFWSVFSRIWIKKYSVFGHFSRSGLLYKLLNKLRFKILGNKEILGKPQSSARALPIVQSYFQKQKFGNKTRELNKISY